MTNTTPLPCRHRRPDRVSTLPLMWIMLGGIAGLFAPPAIAQNASNPGGSITGGADSAASVAAQGLDPNPFQAEAFGLTINLPARATVVAERSDGQLVLSVSDDQSMPTWTLRIQSLIASNEQSTAASQIADLLREFQTSKQPFKILSNAPFRVSGLEGQLCYIERQHKDNQPFVSGWLLLPNGQASFVVFAIQTLPEHMPRLKPLLEASFSTIQLRSVAEVTSERRAMFNAGQALIDSVTPAKLRALVGLSQWYRIYQPGTAEKPGAELGYSLLEVLDAKRGALNPSKPENRYDNSERQSGLMIRIQGRIVVNAERKIYYDSIALYWMAWDKSEEAWSIRGTHRQGEAEQSEAETGIRAPYMPGAPPPRLTIIKSDNTTNAREPLGWDVPDVYLSQPLGWLLAKLMPKDVKQNQEYRYYFYNFGSSQVSQRTDIWGPAADGTGNFTLVTKLTTDSPAITSTYNARGELIRRVHADGSITEPAPVETIHKIWKSKGLQVGKSGR